MSQTVPTAGDPWSPEQANNEPTQKNAGHARIFGFPIEPVGSLTICTAYGTSDDSVAPQPLVRQKPIVSHLHPELFVRVRGFFFVRAAWLIIGLSAADLIWRYCQRHAPRAGSSGLTFVDRLIVHDPRNHGRVFLIVVARRSSIAFNVHGVAAIILPLGHGLMAEPWGA